MRQAGCCTARLVNVESMDPAANLFILIVLMFEAQANVVVGCKRRSRGQ